MEELRFVYKHFRPIAYNAAASLAVITLGERVVGKGYVAYHYQRGESDWIPAEKGGYTCCFVYDNNGTLVASGEAKCSIRDTFCYRLGRDISRGRALKTLEE